MKSLLPIVVDPAVCIENDLKNAVDLLYNKYQADKTITHKFDLKFFKASHSKVTCRVVDRLMLFLFFRKFASVAYCDVLPGIPLNLVPLRMMCNLY